MSVINQVKAEADSLMLASSTVVDIDGGRMIKRLCKHFSHKIDAGWNESLGYIEFAMGFCDMTGSKDKLDFRCGADSEIELKEITDCISIHFARFSRRVECSLQWNISLS